MSSSDSSDEEWLEIIDNLDVDRHFRQRRNMFEEYSDVEFRDRFRFNKTTVAFILNHIEPNIQPTTRRNFSLSANEQLLLTLRFYATGAFQILIGDDLGVHKSTVCRVVTKVTTAIAELGRTFIQMPRTDEEIRKVKQDFYRIRRFPNVLGCVDGCHIPIQSPGGQNAELFRNRKGFFSINVQAICDANLHIRSIDARWPGSAHDSTIFNASLIGAQLNANEFPNSYLLGDSAYTCTNYLLTPLLNPRTPQEERYNAAHIATRNTIERTFGVWKRRFACLSIGLRTNVEHLTLPIIVASAVLHNIALTMNDIDNFPDVIIEHVEINDVFEGQNNVNDLVQRNVILLF